MKYKVLISIFIISVIFCFMTAPIFANYDLDAGTVSSGSLSVYRTKSTLYPEQSNVDGSSSEYSYTLDSGYIAHVVEWDWYTYKSLFKSSTLDYAYKIVLTPTSSATYEMANMQWRLGIATFGDTFSGDITFSGSPTAKQTFWLVNDFKDVNYNLVFYSDCYRYQYLKPDGSVYSTVEPYLGFDIEYIYTITPYTLDDLTDEILNELRANNVLTAEEIAKLDILIQNTDEVEDLLYQLIELLETNNLPKQDIVGDTDDVLNEQEDIKGEITNNNLTPEEFEENLEFEIDTSANSTIWNLVERCLNTNAKVFGLAITALSCGVIKLIFGR